MSRIHPGRNARFARFRVSRPSLTIKKIAEFLERNPKTVNMWDTGAFSSIPLDTIRLLELAFPVEVATEDDRDLIG